MEGETTRTTLAQRLDAIRVAASISDLPFYELKFSELDRLTYTDQLPWTLGEMARLLEAAVKQITGHEYTTTSWHDHSTRLNHVHLRKEDPPLP